jgi:subtilisin family serine protease
MIELTIPKQSPAIQVIEDKISSNEILYAEPNYETFLVEPSATAIFNDPSLSQQWAQSKIQSYNAWTKTKGDSSIIVAVVDTGVDYTHNDLKNSMWVNPHEIVNGIDDDHNGYVDDIYGYDFNNNDSKPMSDDSSTYHGTHVAGTIAATLNNNVGGAGVAPGVKIMALKYLNNFGSGTTSNAIRAIDYAIQNGAKIINNSWGSMNRSQALQDEIEVARLHNILFVAAAGNGDIKGNGINIDRIPFYPAGFSNDNIVSVAASDINDNLAAWSNYGLNSVDVAAPGVNIWSTRNGNTYASLSGTSMATPAVSGVLSLIWSENHNLKYAEVRKILFASVDKIDVMKNKVSAGGRVNAFRAVTMAANTVIPKPTPPPVTPPPVTPPPATQCLP